MTTETPLAIVYASDAAYAAYAGVSLASVIQNNPGLPLRVFLLSDGVRAKDRRRFETLCRENGVAFTLIEVKDLLDRKTSATANNKYLSRTTYARLFIGDLLPEDVADVLYLDCDTLCRGSLLPLWEERLAAPVLLAVEDQGEMMKEHKKHLGLPDTQGYFNAGILLIRLERWRREGWGDRLLAYIQNETGERLAYHDQDALNACLWRETRLVASRWNWQLAEKPAKIADPEIAEATLIHYTGRFKPWQIDGCDGLAKSLYRQAKRRSPWRWDPPQARFLTRKILEEKVGEGERPSPLHLKRQTADTTGRSPLRVALRSHKLLAHRLFRLFMPVMSLGGI